jgi:carboxymethylenebutenolidase
VYISWIFAAGYHMGGPILMYIAAARPDVVGPAASFHGDGLVTNTDNRPHLLILEIKADFLVAIA